MKLEELKEICKILLKYKLKGLDNDCIESGHDAIYLPLPKNITKEDLERLEELHTHIDEEVESLYFFT